MVNIYDDYSNIIGRVKYNNNLDYWDGSNLTCGGLGLHKGLTKLKDGRYILIHGTQWQGSKDYAEVISKEQAVQEIMRSGNTELLELKKFVELKKIYEKEYKNMEEE